MRDRLIELLTDDIPKTDNPLMYVIDELVERIADHLIANGVMLLPCKVWDTVYIVSQNCVQEVKLAYFRISAYGLRFIDEYGRELSCNRFGKTVFLTKEEAERTLGGRQ